MEEMSPIERIRRGIDADDREREAEPVPEAGAAAAPEADPELAELLRGAALGELPSGALDEPFGVERLRRAIPTGEDR